MKKTYFLTLILVLGSIFVKADEGMWLPLLLGKNYAEMQKLGLKLSPQQLYDVNNASLKDAIVQLDGGGCTGEIISPKGLLLTNHHCGYGEIQKHSTVEHDYLTDGFWAMQMSEELVNPGKTASFLVRIEDVTSRMLANVTPTMTNRERSEAVGKVRDEIEKEATKGTDYNAAVRSMFNGNAYYLFVYITYKDVRLVGAPPSAIGKFGGETDNWMWPRHTGDFSIFRVYCGPDGKPAEYSPNNVPITPKHFLPVSMDGVKENDYAMIWGYPGRTDRFLSSWGVDQKVNLINPTCVKLRETKMDIMKEYMNADPKVRIQYASKIAYLGNFWKKDREEAKALVALNVADEKRAIEEKFGKWAALDANKEVYGNVLTEFRDGYKILADGQYPKIMWYFIETMFFQGAEILTYSGEYEELASILEAKGDAAQTIADIKTSAGEHFKDYFLPIDQRVLAAMLKAIYTEVPAEFHPDFFATVNKKFKNDFDRYASFVFEKSIFTSQEKVEKFLANPKAKAIRTDPAFTAFKSLYSVFMSLQMKQGPGNSKIEKSRRLFIAGLQTMEPDKLYYPDANSTMRVTYGKVMDLVPRDAVHYDYQTFLDGIMQKEDPDDADFVVPAKLKEIFRTRNFGKYAEANGKMPVCFLTDNDITGGNSGSPVINAYGELIGCAFDGNSEALSSDIKFDPLLQRTIVVDIRYVLMVIDKYAGAKNLLDELKLVSRTGKI